MTSGLAARNRSEAVDLFDRERPRLLGLAYRMLGSVADADDVVQEAWLRWQRADRAALRSAPAWLTTVTTRLALDQIRSDRRRREDYVGPWLPEPLVSEAGPEERAEMADSLTLGFLTVLDRLTPVERAVFLLADVFAVPFADIARTVDKSDVACRQIATRARRRIRADGPPHHASPDRRVVDDLVMALAAGDVDGVLARLSPEVVCVSDGGATRRAARRPVLGAARVSRFLVNLSSRFQGQFTMRNVVVNGDPGIVVSVHGNVDLVAAFEVDGSAITAIRIVRNPDKLRRAGAILELV
ncbi:MAG: RNA polymerase sigma-70 factor [Acidimicrobiales bacterium]